MSSNFVVGILFYLVPLLILICVCLCCALVRENRRGRTIIRQQHVPIQNTIVNSIEQSSRGNYSSPPPPYSAEPFSNFEESLPSYERAINRPL